MKVLILSLVYPPDNVSTAHIVGALAREFARRGHETTVISSVPHYHPGDTRWMAGARTILGPVVRRSDSDGITVYRVWMPRKSSRLLTRLLAWAWFHLASTCVGLAVARRHDVILTPSPPLTNGLCAMILGRWHGMPYVYNVQEVYPDVALTLGAIRPGVFERSLRRLEGFVYAKAALITVIGSGMRRNLLAKGVESEKVVLIPNFVEVDALPQRSRDNAFAREHDLCRRFVVSYAGNIGAPQGLGIMIDAAEQLRHLQAVLFLFVGDGAACGSLRQAAAARSLTNVRFLPFQSLDRVPDIYAASDACVVPQAAGTGAQGLPSKVYRIIASGRPVIAVCDEDSDVARLVTETGCGVVVRPNDAAALAAAVADASADPQRWNDKGARARALIAETYSLAAVAGSYLNALASASTGTLASGHHGRRPESPGAAREIPGQATRRNQ